MIYATSTKTARSFVQRRLKEGDLIVYIWLVNRNATHISTYLNCHAYIQQENHLVFIRHKNGAKRVEFIWANSHDSAKQLAQRRLREAEDIIAVYTFDPEKEKFNWECEDWQWDEWEW